MYSRTLHNLRLNMALTEFIKPQESDVGATEHMSIQFPKDCLQRKAESKSEKFFHYKLNTDHWLYRQETGVDVGRDCIIELSENDEWHNRKIECQIKGSHKPKYRFRNTLIAYSMEIKTIEYALSSPVPFILVFVDLSNETVFYLPIQEYFLQHPEKYEKVKFNKKTIDVHIPVDQTITEDDKELQELAARIYHREFENG